jgi:hypothetical protein
VYSTITRPKSATTTPTKAGRRKTPSPNNGLTLEQIDHLELQSELAYFSGVADLAHDTRLIRELNDSNVTRKVAILIIKAYASMPVVRKQNRREHAILKARRELSGYERRYKQQIEDGITAANTALDIGVTQYIAHHEVA